MSVAAAIMTIAQNVSESPKPSHPRFTSSAVAFATVATVIHQVHAEADVHHPFLLGAPVERPYEQPHVDCEERARRISMTKKERGTCR